ncbi:MAG TPA: DNA-processing protein DprA, partial [Jiangellaceae bacterium]|nr:DNA-processing protein DprA [Jiangellaceae bacterium]
DLGADLTLAGWTVVSGAAFGIDQAAHRGALAAGGSTMAVLACGADQVYPSSHTRLLERITAEGAVVSELPPGATPTRARFLSRNRLIAGMTRGVTVVEAARRSGALSTATWAAKLGRPVAALPGPVTSALSVGCHDLVRHGAGTLATDAAEVLDAVGRLGIDAAPEPVNPDTVRDRLPDDVAETLEALPASGTATAAQLSARTGFTEQECAAALSMLRDHGMVHRRGAGWQLA